MRVFATIAYKGTDFFGSQIQKETSNTIFGVFGGVLEKLGIDSKVVASGRTDRGVHATGQVCHFDLPPFWDDLEKLHKTLNTMLPPSIVVKKIIQVDDTLHARYSAKKRSYRYILKEGQSNPFEDDLITFVPKIDIQDIAQKLKIFLGEHDFCNFMKTGSDVGSSKRIIYKAFVYKHKNYTIISFEANGFLRSQIRLMVGALLTLSQEDIEAKLYDTKKIKLKPAPGNGLYLSKIKY